MSMLLAKLQSQRRGFKLNIEKQITAFESIDTANIPKDALVDKLHILIDKLREYHSKVEALNSLILDAMTDDSDIDAETEGSAAFFEKVLDCIKSAEVMLDRAGDALHVIEGFRLTSSNYPVIVDTLKERYGKPEVAIFAHFEQLLALPSSQNESVKLQQIYDECEKHIQSLVALGLSEDTFGLVFTPIMLSKLPRAIRIQLHRRNVSKSWTLTNLRSLTLEELQALEMSHRYGPSGSSNSTVKFTGEPNKSHNGSRYKGKGFQPTQGAIVNSSVQKSAASVVCSFCSGSHYADKCTKCTTVEQRKSHLDGRCMKCLLSGHQVKNCTRRTTCYYCKRDNHHSSLCFPEFGKPSKSNRENSTGTKQMVNARLFFDSGSSRSYITTALAQKLDLVISGDEVIYSTKFGDRRRRADIFHNAIVDIPINTGGSVPVSALVTDNICCPIQKYPLNVSSNPILQVIPLADNLVQETEAVPIDILIGQDYIHDFIGTERLTLDNGMYLISSKFGYILTGKITERDFHSNTESLLTVSLLRATAPYSPISLENFWSIEDIGIKDNPYSTDDEAALKIFNRKIRFVDGRYEVGWPWKDQNPELKDNFGLAFGRLKSLVYRFAKEPEILEEYNFYLQDQLSRGFIEEVDGKDSETNIIHYIPRHLVIKRDRATTKLRIVYNASAKCNKNAPNVNECLHRGPVILQDLCGIIIRFRKHSIDISCNKEKAFLQVSLRVTRFLWLKDASKPVFKDNLQVYRFQRVPFGFIFCPFLLEATIQHHLNHQKSFVAKDVVRNIYADNIITGTNTVEEAQSYFHDTKTIFDGISMNVREWLTNSSKFRNTIKPRNIGKGSLAKILGLQWNTDTDTLSCPGFHDFTSSGFTKRSVLKSISSIFDPCGFFSPVVIQGKMILQHIWQDKPSWDDPLSEKTISEYEHIRKDLESISGCVLQWQIHSASPDMVHNYELHCFCDASAKAYAAVICLRCVTKDNRVLTSIVFSKTRLAPIKSITLPRLELMAVLVGVRVTSFVQKETTLPISRVVVWTDSKCVLHWLHSRKVLTVFIENRIKEIKQHNLFQFRYVPTTVNPADLPSRGLSIMDLQNSNLWWNGPNFLVLDDSKWPENDFSSGNLQTEIAKQDVTLTVLSYCSAGIGTIIDINRYSSLNKVLRLSAWCRRFIHNCKKSSPKEHSIVLSVSERGHALHLWIQNVQTSVDIDNQSAFKHLGVYCDENGIYRCKGRFQYVIYPRNQSFQSYYPRIIVLLN